MSVSMNPLPFYQSHKRVEAAEITDFKAEPPAHVDAVVPAADPKDPPRPVRLAVPTNFFSRGRPKPGDFFVRYADGYVSWSPRQIFLDSHTLDPQ